MKLTMKTDNRQLERSLAAASKSFGESSEQALYRWGVQISRELAGATQAFGKGKKTKDIQNKAIYLDAMNVCRMVESRPSLKTPQECYEWIEQHRSRGRRRTVKLPIEQRKTVTPAILQEALKPKRDNAGMAKGAWFGSGNQLSSKQSGTQKVNIGKNFLPHAQKFANLGNATTKRSVFSPKAELNNTVKHSSSPEILSQSRKTQVVKRAMLNILKWYDKAATAKFKKQKAA